MKNPYLLACIVMAVLIALVVLHKWAAARELKRLWADIPEVRTFIEVSGMRVPIGDFDPDQRHMRKRKQ